MYDWWKMNKKYVKVFTILNEKLESLGIPVPECCPVLRIGQTRVVTDTKINCNYREKSKY